MRYDKYFRGRLYAYKIRINLWTITLIPNHVAYLIELVIIINQLHSLKIEQNKSILGLFLLIIYIFTNQTSL